MRLVLMAQRADPPRRCFNIVKLYIARQRQQRAFSASVAVLLSLVLWFSSLALAQNSGLTLTGTFHMDDVLTGPSRYLVAEVSSESEERLLTVEWVRNDSAWFPYWALMLRSEAGLLTRGSEVELARISPTAGGIYDWELSLDTIQGRVALRMTDSRSGDLVYAGGREIQPYAGKVYPSPAAGGRVVAEQYLPIATSWQSGVRGDGGSFLALRRFEPNTEALVRVNVVETLAAGEFRIVARSDGSQEATVLVEPFVPTQGATFIDLPLELLPVGRSKVALEFIDGENVLYSWPQDVLIGNVTARVGWQNRVVDEGITIGELTLQSDSALGAVEIAVYASFARMVWDEEQRLFETEPFGSRQLIHTGQVEIVDGVTSVAFTTPLPEAPAVWEVTYEVVTAPDVVSHTANGTHYLTTYPGATIEPGEAFTVVVLPDTQYWSKSYAQVYMRVGEWIAANAADKRIALVLHMGDVTNENVPDQWLVAARSMKLWNGIVPYVVTVGNHDYVTDGRPGGHVKARGTSRINQYFFPEEFPHLAGMLEEGRLENAYYTLEIGGIDFLIIDLEFGAPDEALEWANEVAAQYPDHFGIFVTHTYTSPSGPRNYRGYLARSYEIASNPDTTVNDGEDMWWKFVRHHRNLHMVLSGHRYSPAIPLNVGRGVHGNNVYEMLIDYQNEDYGGNGYIVLFEFRPDGRVKVDAYSPFLDQYKTDVAPNGFTNSFTLNFADVLVRQ